MRSDSRSLYQALIARDARFDGLFFVGVTSTGIYCRPICPVKPPRELNCRFYNSAAEAEQAGFRPCLRCRPELAPGNSSLEGSQRLAHLFVQRIEEGGAQEGRAVDGMARELQLSSRQMRRIIQKELGVAPVQWLLTRRLLLAKQLLTETILPVIDVAFASGFSSLRRFNHAFATRYGMPPTRLRKKIVAGAQSIDAGFASRLQLSYRPPYDWTGMLAFLKGRELKGVEWVTDEFYARTVRLGNATGWIKVWQEKNALTLEFAHGLAPVLPALLHRVRHLFDLDARPDNIARHLRNDPVLGHLVRANEGLRVPGAFDGFELGVRAILGQQVTVQAATKMAGRLVASFSEPLATPFAPLTHLTPSAEKLARATAGQLALHGIVSARCESVRALARAQISGHLFLERGPNLSPEQAMHRLAEIPGIGPWTANYIAMRAYRWPDAFPKEDIALRKALGGVTARQAEAISQPWRPWRSYAALHLWRSARLDHKAAKLG